MSCSSLAVFSNGNPRPVSVGVCLAHCFHQVTAPSNSGHLRRLRGGRSFTKPSQVFIADSLTPPLFDVASLRRVVPANRTNPTHQFPITRTAITPALAVAKTLALDFAILGTDAACVRYDRANRGKRADDNRHHHRATLESRPHHRHADTRPATELHHKAELSEKTCSLIAKPPKPLGGDAPGKRICV